MFASPSKLHGFTFSFQRIRLQSQDFTNRLQSETLLLLWTCGASGILKRSGVSLCAVVFTLPTLPINNIFKLLSCWNLFFFFIIYNLAPLEFSLFFFFPFHFRVFYFVLFSFKYFELLKCMKAAVQMKLARLSFGLLVGSVWSCFLSNSFRICLSIS